MLRQRGAVPAEAIGDIIDYVCHVARPQQIFYLCAHFSAIRRTTWLPKLPWRPEQKPSSPTTSEPSRR